MADTHGNEGVNFYGKRGVNAADPINDKDVVNLRSLRRTFAIATANTLTSICIRNIGVGYPVYALPGDTDSANTCYEFRSLSAGTNLSMLSSSTITFYLNDNIVINGLTANTITSSTIYAGLITATTISTVTIDAQFYTSAGTPLNFVEKIWCAYTGSIESVIRNNFTNNQATGQFSIVGGAASSATTDYAGISSGSGNTINGNGNYGFIGGGAGNRITGLTSVITGGINNFGGGQYSLIGNGSGNTILSSGGTYQFSTILNGRGNKINFSNHSSIISGEYNTVYGHHSTIIGGSGSTVASGLTHVTILGVDNLAPNISDRVYTPGLQAVDLQSASNNFVFTEPNGHLILSSISSVQSILSGSSFTGITSAATVGVGFPVISALTNTVLYLRSFSAGTNLNLATGDTITYNLNDNIVLTGITAFTISSSTVNAVNIDAQYYFSGGVPLNFTFTEKLWCASTGTQAIVRNNYTNNVAQGNFSIIVGAYGFSTGNFSIIAGGSGNTSYGNFGFVGGGIGNKQYLQHSFVGGGAYNIVSGQSAVVVGGFGNIVKRNFANILGGFGNYNISVMGSIVGGNTNSASTNYSTVIGGSTNSSAGNFSLLGSGYRNTILGTYGFIGNGLNNNIKTLTKFSSILNGENNTVEIETTHSSIVGGSGHTINSGLTNTVIAGGQSLIALSSNTIYVDHEVARSLTGVGIGLVYVEADGHLIRGSVISGGSGGTTTISGITSIVNTGATHGILSVIDANNIAYLKALSAGTNINIYSSTTENIIALNNNISIDGLTANTITANTIVANLMTATTISSITIDAQFYTSAGTPLNFFFREKLWCGSTGTQSIIRNNYTGSLASGNFAIIGGASSTSSGDFSVIAGGSGNTLNSHFGLIGSGRDNYADGVYSSVIGGINNVSSGGSSYSFLGNGISNRIDANGGYNFASTILNGNNNLIFGGGNHHAILGGNNNLIFGNGNHHAILGGYYNSASSLSSSVIINGSYNKNYGKFSIVGQGFSNEIQNELIVGSILNGLENKLLNSNPLAYTLINPPGSLFIDYSCIHISNGIANTASTMFSTILNGKRHLNRGINNFIGNGDRNITYFGYYSNVLNGSRNRIYGKAAGTPWPLAVSDFQIDKKYNSVLNGVNNYIVSTNSTILNGSNNKIYGKYNSIINGYYNSIGRLSSYNAILNGTNNIIRNNISNSSILAGTNNLILSGLSNISILGGSGLSALSSNTIYVDHVVARSLTSATISYVFAEPDGHLIIGSGPLISAGITNIVNTGATHGIWVQTNNGVAVLKALSAGTNMNLFSSSTENTFALKDDIVVNSVSGLTVSGGTFLSGSTDISNFFRYYWTASTGLHSLIRNNNTDNLASGAHSWVSGKANTATTAYSFIAQGWENKATGNHAFIGAGRSNSALTSAYATVLNGKQNTASGIRSTVINGQYNYATTTSSVVISGNFNSAKTQSFATVINGVSHLASGLYSFIGNGDSHSASTAYAIVLNGLRNTASGAKSTVINGVDNFAKTSYSFVGNGLNNSATTLNYATVLNGILNLASNTHATIINGSGNTASGIRSTVINGQSNFAKNTSSLVGSGTFNSAQTGSFATVINGTLGLSSGLYSIIGTGKGNTASGTRSTVINGLYNYATSTNAFVGAGTYNSGKTTGFATVINGTLNLSSGAYSFIGNGISNTASNGRATVLNGKENQATSIYTTVINGSGNTASGNRSIVVGGISNLASSTYATTINGKSNRAIAEFSFVGNGSSNSAHTSYSTVLNGLRNHIYTSSFANILNGTDNTNRGQNSTILAGTDNVLTGSHAVIMGGVRNSGLTTYSIIGSGIDNRVSNSWSVILGGSGNTIDSVNGFFTDPDSDFIGGGQNNFIGGIFARRSFIGNGINNRLLTNNSGTILNGVNNYISYTNGGYSQILNGHGNIIYHGTYLATPSHNTIIGGHYNFVGNSTTYSPASRVSHCTIIAGRYNTGFTNYGAIITGIRNWARGTHSVIVAGSGNTTNATKTFIANGQRNSITGTYSSIINGTDNYVAASQAFISNGTNLGLSSAAIRSAIIGGRNYTGTTADMVYVPEATVWELTNSSVNTDFISVDVDGRLYRTDIASLGTLIGSTSSISGITNIGSTHGVWAQTVANVAQLKGLSGGSNMLIASSSTTNAISLSPSVSVNSLNVSGNTILSSTTAMTMTVLSLSGGGTLMVVTDNNGLLGTQAIPGGGPGSSISAINTGSTHGVFAGMSGSSVLVFKALSAGTNMLISSSITENSIALASDITLSSVSATSISASTFYSGSSLLSTVINNSILNNFRASALTSSQFTGNPKKATISFVNVFTDDGYAISIVGDEERSWTFENKTSSGFIINSNSNVALTGATHWVAQKYYI